MRSVEMRSPTPSSEAAMPPMRSSSISPGTTEATMNPSGLTTLAPMISGALARRPRRTSLIFSLLVAIAPPLGRRTRAEELAQAPDVDLIGPLAGVHRRGLLPLAQRPRVAPIAQEREAALEPLGGLVRSAGGTHVRDALP